MIPETRNKQTLDLRYACKKRDADTEPLRRRVYDFSSLAKYKLRDRMLIRAADIFFYWLIKLICSTVRWEVRGMNHFDEISARGNRAIMTSWHSCIFGATWVWRGRGIVVMSSHSRDAEYIGRFIKRLGYGTARGSATRGGQRALLEMAECLANGIDVGFTIDGPRGPAFVAKPGAVTLARHTGQAILPFHVAARRCIELPTWDRLQIPVPFTRAIVLIAEPIYVPRDATSEEIKSKQTQLQTALDRLRAEGETWRKERG
ncbi:MAG: lysophospholipid acyltransferase family protein [Acidobacteriota bacterium]